MGTSEGSRASTEREKCPFYAAFLSVVTERVFWQKTCLEREHNQALSVRQIPLVLKIFLVVLL